MKKEIKFYEDEEENSIFIKSEYDNKVFYFYPNKKNFTEEIIIDDFDRPKHYFVFEYKISNNPIEL
ncbi:MAG: hypothetical protein QM532_03615 [Cyanobium sp. MAG06]|nr:hypothetical protein [Cyanobium sp. MAG06]